MAENPILRVIEDSRTLDRIADPVRRPIQELLHRSPALRAFLKGTWLGHPLHSILTDIPVGAWTAGLLLDGLELGGNTKLRDASDLVTGLGFAGALGAAITGAADWSSTHGNPKRAGFVHALANVTVTGLYTASLVLRARKGKKAKGQRRVALGLSMAGYGVLMFSSWLGGELSYHYGLGVRPQAERDWLASEGNGDAKTRDRRRGAAELPGSAEVVNDLEPSNG